MKTVRDEDGNIYHLLKRSADSSLVRDPRTGERRYVENDRLEDCAGATPLEQSADAVDPAVRTLLGSAHDDEDLGLLVELADRGPLGVVTILECSGWCESDLGGRLARLRLAGLLEETVVDGERGYRLTETGARALAVVRLSPSSSADDPIGADRDRPTEE